MENRRGRRAPSTTDSEQEVFNKVKLKGPSKDPIPEDDFEAADEARTKREAADDSARAGPLSNDAQPWYVSPLFPSPPSLLKLSLPYVCAGWAGSYTSTDSGTAATSRSGPTFPITTSDERRPSPVTAMLALSSMRIIAIR